VNKQQRLLNSFSRAPIKALAWLPDEREIAFFPEFLFLTSN
jgi:hypothetical protein